MPIATAITQRGFRKWYERELIRSHSHLVLLLLCAVAVLGSLEAFSAGRGDDRLLMVVSLLVAAAVGAWALRRYLFFLMRAEVIANQASCAQCKAYGRWQVEASQSADSDRPEAAAAMSVCCRKCGHRWRIEW